VAVSETATSGNRSFDHFAQTRFVLDGAKVKALPDPLGGRYSVGMTPEQAEFLGRRLLWLAGLAAANRDVQCPGLFDPLVPSYDHADPFREGNDAKQPDTRAKEYAVESGEWGALPAEPCRYCRQVGGVFFRVTIRHEDLQETRCDKCGRSWVPGESGA
jgi:hypothetical protein